MNQFMSNLVCEGFSSCSTEILSWKWWNAKRKIWWSHTSVPYLCVIYLDSCRFVSRRIFLLLLRYLTVIYRMTELTTNTGGRCFSTGLFKSVFWGIPDATDLITIFARERSITIIAPGSIAVLVKLNKLCFQMNNHDNKHMKLYKGLHIILKIGHTL